MTLDTWRETGEFSQHRGHRIFYRDAGSGEAVVCIHGFPTASWDWHLVWPRLCEEFRLIAPDMLGFGFSDKPAGYRYSIHDQADLIEGLLDGLGIRRVRILAHDYGDTVAQELLARFEERQRSADPGIDVTSICFLNGGLFPESHRLRPIQRLLRSRLGPLVGRLTSEKRFRKAFSEIFGPRTRPSIEDLRAFWRLIETNGGRRIAHRLIRYIDERTRFRERWVGALQASTIPLRLIDGPEDPVAGRHMADRYRELVPNADVVLLDGIGHYPQLEDSPGVLRAVLAFWNGKTADSPPCC